MIRIKKIVVFVDRCRTNLFLADVSFNLQTLLTFCACLEITRPHPNVTLNHEQQSNDNAMGPLAAFIFFVIFKICDSYTIPLNEDFLKNPRYNNYDDLTNLFKNLEKTYPGLAKMHSIGRSVRNRELWALEINSNVNNRTLLTPMFKYVANMHGDESIGRQMTIYLAQYLLANYNKDERITKLINNTDIYLMPSMNPDGYENSKVGDVLFRNISFLSFIHTNSLVFKNVNVSFN